MNKMNIPVWKRVIDIFCIIVTLPITLPLSLLISGYIKLVSPGPIFFKQDRIGFNCKIFTCYKFRSMNYNTDPTVHKEYLKQLIAMDIPMTKIDDRGDNRLIFGGKFLRSTGLDELPQLINIFKGEMSIVGPRPCIPYEFDQFEEKHKNRFNVLPGITGLWQVNGKNKTTFQRMIELDVEYSKNVNILTDIKILIKTIPVILYQVINNVSLPTNKKMESKTSLLTIT